MERTASTQTGRWAKSLPVSPSVFSAFFLWSVLTLNDGETESHCLSATQTFAEMISFFCLSLPLPPSFIPLFSFVPSLSLPSFP